MIVNCFSLERALCCGVQTYTVLYLREYEYTGILERSALIWIVAVAWVT